MRQEEWKYKITNGKAPVVLTFLMAALFGGLTVWLHNTNNGAYIFTAMLTVVMLIVLSLTIYRLLFYKVLIGADDVYYQSNFRNGRCYAYTEIEKAWISSGTAQNGGQEQYCNISVYGENVIRFPFFYRDEKAVKYLIKRADTVKKKNVLGEIAEKDEYLIDGKVFGKTKIGIGMVLLVILVLIDVLIIQNIGFHPMLILGFVMEIAICWMLFVDYMFFQVRIEKNRFYCRTTPFNGQWYQYREITDCREIKKVVCHRQYRRGISHRRYFFFFEFTASGGKTQKFQFAKEIYEHEVNVLKERIEQAHS